jgi:predicted nucleotide-binding protein
MSIANELYDVARAAEAALLIVRDPSIKGPLECLRTASSEIERSWSGSNLGYHATVYCVGLQPKPPNMHFSSEWGLKDVWPAHQPHDAWMEFDHNDVVAEILRRAGSPNLEEINSKLAPVREHFHELKERSLSALTVAKGTYQDAFLVRKIEQIEKLEAFDVSTIVRGILPNQVMSRDSLASHQGIKAAPHQCVGAIPVAAYSLEKALSTIAQVCRESAAHTERAQGVEKVRTSTSGTKIFIGHGGSPIWRDLKDFIVDRLKLPVNEFSSVPVAGVSTQARLSQLLDDSSFAFLIMTAEDERADGKHNARLNVVHEAGLFQGRFGFNRAIILIENGCEEFSNISGLGQIRFPRSNLAPAFEEIRKVLEREGMI